jgi:ABC-type transporter Mla MlaB component
MAAQNFAIVAKAHRFTHPDANQISKAVLAIPHWRTVVLDLSRSEEATTSAFARLVILRRELLSRGRDLQLVGMRDRVKQMYDLNRLSRVLPCA